jgi:ABC-type sugar transport system ATPase subunit
VLETSKTVAAFARGPPIWRHRPIDVHRAVVFRGRQAGQRLEIAVKALQGFFIIRIDDGDRLVSGLFGGERQSLAIARALHFGARVLILDEPTAVLGVEQAAHVLRIVNEAKKRWPRYSSRTRSCTP